MKRSLLYCTAAVLSISLFFSCKKQEPQQPPKPACAVQQFGAPISNVPVGPTRLITTVPYIFKNTFDNAGKVKMIDAYLFDLSGATHHTATISYQGNMGYLISTEAAKDTIFVFTLNSSGKVIRADERIAFSSPYTSKFRCDFEYNAQGKLFRTHLVSLTDNFTNRYDTTIYDALGNVTINAIYKYEYDLTKTAKKQFYHDVEVQFPTFYKGQRLLSYLGYFPELTSPPNLRIISRSSPTSGGAYYINLNLYSHQLDASGKLISYGYGYPGSTTSPITWNCDAVQP